MKTFLVRISSYFLIISIITLSNYQLLFPQFKFQGHVFFENQRTKPLENARVSIWSNKYIRTSTSDINGNFRIELDSGFNRSFYLLCYKVGFYTRIYYLTGGQSLSQDIGMKIVFIPQDRSLINTTFICGRLIQSNLTPVPFVEVFGDYGERPVVSDDLGNFKLPISKAIRKNETYLWFEKEGYNPLVYQVSNFERYDENNQLIITLEPLPISFNFDFSVYRSDTDKPIENVEIEIDGESVGRTNDEGKFLINNRFDREKASIITKFSHELFCDTTLSLNLSSFGIAKTIKLHPPSYKINALVYYNSTHQTLIGVPDVEFKLGNILINRTNSLGQSRLIFEAIPGDKIFIKFPIDKGYIPSDTSITVTKDQSSLNINVYRIPVEINIIAFDSVSGEKITDIDSLELTIKNYTIKAKKIDDKFIYITNIFDPEDKLRINMISKKYEYLKESIQLNQIDKNVYECKFYVKSKKGDSN